LGRSVRAEEHSCADRLDIDDGDRQGCGESAIQRAARECRVRAELSQRGGFHEVLGRRYPPFRGNDPCHWKSRMKLRSDHIAGIAFILFGIAVFAISTDLPFGSLSAPGAGMMPKLVTALMVAFGVALMFGAGASKPFAEIEWSDYRHAAMVIIIAAAA